MDSNKVSEDVLEHHHSRLIVSSNLRGHCIVLRKGQLVPWSDQGFQLRIYLCGYAYIVWSPVKQYDSLHFRTRSYKATPCKGIITCFPAQQWQHIQESNHWQGFYWGWDTSGVCSLSPNIVERAVSTPCQKCLHAAFMSHLDHGPGSRIVGLHQLVS